MAAIPMESRPNDGLQQTPAEIASRHAPGVLFLNPGQIPVSLMPKFTFRTVVAAVPHCDLLFLLLHDVRDTELRQT
jgi:hypothetical protein